MSAWPQILEGDVVTYDAGGGELRGTVRRVVGGGIFLQVEPEGAAPEDERIGVRLLDVVALERGDVEIWRRDP